MNPASFNPAHIGQLTGQLTGQFGGQLSSSPFARQGKEARAAQFRVVLLQIDALQLMLPQVEVRSVESSQDVRQHEPAQGEADSQALGQLVFAGSSWPVYCIDAQFQTLATASAGRRACVLLQVGDCGFGLLVDDARILNDFDGQVHALPDVMRTPRTPVTGLLQHEGKLACFSNVVRLAATLHAPSHAHS